MRDHTEWNEEKTTAEGLLSHPIQESFHHDVKGEIHGGKDDHLG